MCEPLDLRIKDLQFEGRKMFIMGGKFRKDRVVNLPELFGGSISTSNHRSSDCFRAVMSGNETPLQIPNQLWKKIS